MDNVKPKIVRHEHESGHDRRRSTGNHAFSDSETIPNYLRARRGSCHDLCKSGFVGEDEQLIKPSRAAAGVRLLRKNKSAINSEAALAAVGGRLLRKNKSAINSEAARDSITRTGKVTKKETNTSQSKPMNSRAQPPRRSFSDVGDPRRLLLGTSNDIQDTRLVKKHVRVLPHRSTVKSFSNKIPKKPNNTTTKKNRKHYTEHVPEEILHVVDAMAESQDNDITLSSSDSLDSICDSSLDEITCQKEATTSELVHSEETSQCTGLTDTNTDKQETESNAKTKREVTSNESEDSDSSPRKLKFRRGKVLNVQQMENSTKKLNFAEQGILTENQDCNIPGVRLRETELANPQSCPINHMPTVELRGQVVEENSGSPSSYNTIIKETANKLSKTNSKVKSLVGAFESVISLLDTNSQSSKGKKVPLV